MATSATKSTLTYEDYLDIPGDDRYELTPSNIQGAPDLLVEILSPSTRRLDITTKPELYARHCVKEYWIADPGARTISVMLLKYGRYETVREYGAQDILASPTLKDFSAPIASIFR